MRVGNSHISVAVGIVAIVIGAVSVSGLSEKAFVDFSAFPDGNARQQNVLNWVAAGNWDRNPAYENSLRLKSSGAQLQISMSLRSDPGQATLRIQHLSSKASACPNNGYSPVDIQLRSNKGQFNIASNRSPSSHGMITETWDVSGKLGTRNVLTIQARDLCSHYWVRRVELEYRGQDEPPDKPDDWCVHYDQNSNGVIDDSEYFQAKDDWEAGKISDAAYFEVKDCWENQQPPEDTTPPSVPQLVSPPNGATLPNGSLDQTQDIVWEFDWTDAQDDQSGVKGYQIIVENRDASKPAIDTFVSTSRHRHVCEGCYIASHNLEGWTWRVRAQDHAGNWSDWSRTHTCSVEPPSGSNDADNDGVPDTRDECPNTPGPESNDGCPVDSDGDGVPDRQDDCPNEPGPASNNGCPDKPSGKLCVGASTRLGDVILSHPVQIQVDPLPSGGQGNISGDADWCGSYSDGTTVQVTALEERFSGGQGSADYRLGFWSVDDQNRSPGQISTSVTINADTTRYATAYYYTPRSGERVEFVAEVTEFGGQGIGGELSYTVRVEDVRTGSVSRGQEIDVHIGAQTCPTGDTTATVDRDAKVGNFVKVKGLTSDNGISVICQPDEFTITESPSQQEVKFRGSVTNVESTPDAPSVDVEVEDVITGPIQSGDVLTVSTGSIAGCPEGRVDSVETGDRVEVLGERSSGSGISVCFSSKYYLKKLRSESGDVKFRAVIEETRRVSGVLTSQVRVTEVLKGELPRPVQLLLTPLDPDNACVGDIDRSVSAGDRVEVLGQRQFTGRDVATDNIILCSDSDYYVKKIGDDDENRPKGGVAQFDANGNCLIDRNELDKAVEQWQAGKIDGQLLLRVGNAFLDETDVCEAASAEADPPRLRAIQSSMGPGQGLKLTARGQGISGIGIEVYDQNGRAVAAKSADGAQLQWRLRTDTGRPVANGVYLYVVTVQGSNGKTIRTNVKKLIVLR